jgi:UPF0176 protein
MKTPDTAYSVLLYYCYTPIADPQEYRDQTHKFCIENNLLGRIIIAEEGLNGTVSGRAEDCQKYMDWVNADGRFTTLEFKVEHHYENAFQKLHVRVKPEIVHSSLTHLRPHEKTGTHLSPQDFHKLKNEEDVVIVDVRSNYEHKLGHFKNAVTFDIENFRDFPDKVGELSQYKGKKVVTYCTGGIKCEKASAFLLEQGFENVYQLHGGIIKYGLETDGEDFEGSCYVFDGRLTTEINKKNPKVISTCHVCNAPSDRMVNCANSECNVHVPICEECGDKMEGACSEECRTHPAKRPYDGSGYYRTSINGYDPMQGYRNLAKKK